MIKLYNSLNQKKEIFNAIDPKEVRLYACGPTVYDYVHIGNFRTYIMEDILNRVLKYNGYRTLYVQNITDVGHLVGDGDEGEDKMEKGARLSGKTAWEIAEFYEKGYKDDSEKLNILKPDILSKATGHIEEQIEMIKKLEETGFAYRINDGIYFDTSKLSDYGKLIKLDKEKLKEGARVEKNPEKKSATDFALWKFSPKDKKRQMEWNSPWGIGFPGWHIECSAMSIKYLGEPFDIHAGATDLMPVHHTNEIAQNEAVYGHKTVNYWIHGAFLLVNGGRMGKSLGNAHTISELEKRGFDPLVYRYFTMSAHYRQPLNFTWQALEGSKSAYESLVEKLSQIIDKDNKISEEDFDKKYEEAFRKATDDDLNMPEAVAVLWNLMKDVNVNNDIKVNTIAKFDKVLGLSLIEKAQLINSSLLEIPKEIIDLTKERDMARENKDWKKSDELRKKIMSLGFEVRDTNEGGKIRKK